MKTDTTPKKLKRGARIRVYEKPLTGESLEGIATLHRHEGYHGESYYPNGPQGQERMIYLWSVRFDGESRVVDRRVSPDDLC